MTSLASTRALPTDVARAGEAATPRLQCPACRQPLDLSSSLPEWRCGTCGFLLVERDGILRAMTPESKSRFHQFVRDYQAVRELEGRGSSSPDYYLRLPYEDVSGRNRWQWAIRARTFRHLERHVLPVVERTFHGGCDVLDLGAGNGWLSYRLGLRGHRPIAVDLLDNDADGLGAGKHYIARLDRPFLRFQAEMDRLPFRPHQFDMAIFNASIHYSVDYAKTLGEVLRCLRRPGHIIIADSPFYHRHESGQAMRVEKHAAFQRQFGFRSDSIPACEFLTQDVLDELSKMLGIEWRVLKPWYGLGWALRPLQAWLKRRREPSKFYLIWGQVKG